MLEQVPAQMGDGAVRWAKLVIPLVVHSASKVRLRAAAAMEMGMPLLLEKQVEVAAIIEPMMSSVSICVSVSGASIVKFVRDFVGWMETRTGNTRPQYLHSSRSWIV